MATSRGITNPAVDEDDVAIKQQGNTALVNARRNFKYLINPQSSDRPGRLRTRALLRTFRYIGQFVIWRLVRWAKYAAVGALVAAISATAFGSVITGAAWLAAPPTVGASIIAASVWAVGKFAARRLHKRWERTGGDEGEARREVEEDSPVRREGTIGQEIGPQAVPW
jgi:hypothetical protein